MLDMKYIHGITLYVVCWKYLHLDTMKILISLHVSPLFSKASNLKVDASHHSICYHIKTLLPAALWRQVTQLVQREELATTVCTQASLR